MVVFKIKIKDLLLLLITKTNNYLKTKNYLFNWWFIYFIKEKKFFLIIKKINNVHF